MTRGSNRLPRHKPPMNVPSSTASETAEDPTTSCSSWNHTIWYIRAAHPLANDSAPRSRSRRRDAPGGAGILVIARPLLITAKCHLDEARRKDLAKAAPRVYKC